MQVVTPLIYRDFEFSFEDCSSRSLTVPDQTMTIREIMQRYASGASLGGSDTYYDEDDELPDYRTLDLAEIQEIKEYRDDLLKNIQATKSTSRTTSKDSDDASPKPIPFDYSPAAGAKTDGTNES